MFRQIRYCIVGMKAGLIGMAAGMAGQVYVNEFTDKPAELLQAMVVFREIDELSFVVSFVSILGLALLCAAVEIKRRVHRSFNRDMEYVLVGEKQKEREEEIKKAG